MIIISFILCVKNKYLNQKARRNIHRIVITIACTASLFPNLALSKEKKGGIIDLDAVVIADFSRYDGAHSGYNYSDGAWGIRRARISLEHETKDGWESEIDIDFNENDSVDLKGVSIRYDFSSGVKLRMGKVKEGFGLENTMAFNDLPTLERSVATEAFSPGRNFGVNAEYQTEMYYGEVGMYQLPRAEIEKQRFAYTVRSVFTPIKTDSLLFHLGGNYTHRKLEGSEYRINNSIEISTGEKFVESEEILADSISTYSFESAFMYKMFSIQGEYFEQEIALEDEAYTTNYRGHYLSIGTFITPNQRKYKNGTFDGVEMSGDNIAVELVGRIGEVDLIDRGNGMAAEHVSLSVNFHFDKKIRAMLHFSKVKEYNSSHMFVGDGISSSLRFSYQY